jgi:hypothetical protein
MTYANANSSSMWSCLLPNASSVPFRHITNGPSRPVGYTYSLGSLLGAHSNHFHGQTFLRSTKLSLRNDVVGVIPGTSETVEMLTDNPGTWFVHCHVGTLCFCSKCSLLTSRLCSKCLLLTSCFCSKS